MRETTFVLMANAMLRASGTLLFVLVGRLSGPDDAGVFALALGYLAILTTLFTGIDDLLIKEVTAAPENVLRLVAAYGMLRMPLVVLLYGVIIGFARTATQMSSDQMMVLSLVVLSAVFEGVMGIGQAVLYSFGNFKSLLYSAVVVFVLRTGIGSLVLATRGLLAATTLWPISSLAGAIVVLSSAIWTVKGSRISLTPLALEGPILRRLAVLMPSFGTVSLLSALEYQCDVILLAMLRASSAVAIYAAAVSVVNILALISQAYRIVLFPRLVRLRDNTSTVVGRLVWRAAGHMAVLGIAIALGVTLMAHWLIHQVFGARFQATEPVLEVLIWNVVFLFVNVPFVRYLMATGQQNRVSGALVLSMSANLGANLLLIPYLGPTGAAWSRLASSTVFLISVSILVVRRLRRPQPLESTHAEVVQ